MIPSGKGVFIWQLKNCFGGNLDILTESLVQVGFSWVAVKLADGTADYNAAYNPGLLFSKLRARGIKPYGWQYIYGGNIYIGTSIAANEAVAADRNIVKYAPDGWMIDPESEYKRSGAYAWADTYMHSLRAGHPALSIGLCSYRFPSLHAELPWTNFLEHTDFHIPQVYWVGANNPGVQLQRSYSELNALKKLPFVPLGAAYYENGWGPTVPQLNEFDNTAHTLGLPGVGWWSWDSAGIQDHPDWLAAITAHKWSVFPPPPTDWAHSITRWARDMGYKGPEPE